MHVIAAKAVCFKEALDPSFKTYQEQIVKNAKALAESLMKRGFRGEDRDQSILCDHDVLWRRSDSHIPGAEGCRAVQQPADPDPDRMCQCLEPHGGANIYPNQYSQ